MVEYIKKGLPDEYHHIMTRYEHVSDPDNVMNVVGSIGADWSGTSSPKRKSQQRSSSKISDDTKIQIILVDDTNEDERHCLDIGSSTTLKTVFNEYAEKRSVSLRSLRFSYAGKTLFLSSVGNRTPEEMQMRDQDVISVHDTNKPSSQESSSNGNANNQTNKSSSPKKSKYQHHPGVVRKRTRVRRIRRTKAQKRRTPSTLQHYHLRNTRHSIQRYSPSYTRNANHSSRTYG